MGWGWMKWMRMKWMGMTKGKVDEMGGVRRVGGGLNG